VSVGAIEAAAGGFYYVSFPAWDRNNPARSWAVGVVCVGTPPAELAPPPAAWIYADSPDEEVLAFVRSLGCEPDPEEPITRRKRWTWG
jgi:hypothetical protein